MHCFSTALDSTYNLLNSEDGFDGLVRAVMIDPSPSVLEATCADTVSSGSSPKKIVASAVLCMAISLAACQPVAALSTPHQQRRRDILGPSSSSSSSRLLGVTLDESSTATATSLPLRQQITWPDVAPLPVVGDDGNEGDYPFAHVAVNDIQDNNKKYSGEINYNQSPRSSQPPSGVRNFRFAAPLLEFGYPPAVEEYRQNRTASKPLLLFLPGFDATFLSAFLQYPELHTLFEVRCLVSSMDDRSTLDEMKDSAVQFVMDQLTTRTTTTDASLSNHPQHDNIRDLNIETAHEKTQTTSSPWDGITALLRRKKPPAETNNGILQNTISNRPVYIAGESFGGILACEVALALMDEKRLDNLKGLVLINSATCYDRSKLAAEAPPVTRLPKNVYLFGLLKLLPMFFDDVSLPQLLAIFQGKALPSVIDNPVREAYMGRLAFSLPFLLKFMPQETLQWRLTQWLEVGCSRMATKLYDLAKHRRLRTLIIAGEKDLALPSIAEAERLAQILPNSQVHVVDGAGHANTCGSRLDLAAMMRRHFGELRIKPRVKRQIRKTDKTQQNHDNAGRTAMKKVAAEGQGVFFGMEPRYDGKRIGLSPLSYWSEAYYQKMEDIRS